MMQISRRRFLALSATLTLAACADDDSTSESTVEPEPTTPATAETAPGSALDTASETTALTSETTAPTVATGPAVELADDPFLFGVASGDPDDSSVVIWTRLAGELPDDGITVDWEFVGDSGATSSGTATTSQAVGSSVHALIEIDEPGSYTFSAGGWSSATGRTAPLDPGATAIAIAVASCQHFETGNYAAHRDIAEWGPDLVFWLGDFIYEGDPMPVDSELWVRSHEGPEPTTIEGYRVRYATYLADPHLQASRAAAPWIAIWDDHEVENNYAGVFSENDDDPTVFAGRRSAGYQAWWENTPTRLDAPGADRTEPYVIYRGVEIGDLMRVSFLDGRQFRDPVLSREILQTGPPVPGWDDPGRSMLGTEQETWLDDRFATSTATWNCLAQQTILSDVRLGEVGAILNYDQWDGYHAARQRLLTAAPTNLITLTGDIHLAGVGRLGPPEAPVGVEFVSTSISSAANVDPAFRDVVIGIPSIVDAELSSRGYTRHTVTADSWTAEYRTVADVRDADSDVTTWKTFRVDVGSPAVNEA